MPIKTKEGLYKCDHCSKTLKTLSGIKRHMYYKHELPKTLPRKKTIENAVENIRTTSKSVHEVVTRLQKMWLGNGLKVSFNSYPSVFEYSVSNSHNSPKGYPRNWSSEPHLPKGYPGWSGRWAGKVEVVDTKRWGKEVSFRDLQRGIYHKGLPAIPWLCTGSGSQGDDFSIGGMLFLYDFPVMHEQFKANGNEFKVLEHDYNHAVNAYTRKFMMEREHHVKSSELFQEARRHKEAADKLAKHAGDLLTTAAVHLQGEFNEKHDLDLPMPTSMFVNDGQTKTMVIETNKPKIPPPNLEPSFEYINRLAQEMAEYVENNPEAFI